MVGWKKLPGPATVGSQTTLVQIFLAGFEKSGLAKRAALDPEPAKKSTLPLGSRAACTASTPEWKGRSSQRPSRAGTSSSGSMRVSPAFWPGGASTMSRYSSGRPLRRVAAIPPPWFSQLNQCGRPCHRLQPPAAAPSRSRPVPIL